MEETSHDNFSFMCSFCNSQIATSFCICEYPSPFLCSSCLPSHFQKATLSFHSSLPLVLIPYTATREMLLSLRLKVLKLQSAEQDVKESCREVERCQELICARCEEMVQELSAQKDREVRALEQYKTFLNGGLETSLFDAKSHLMDSDFQSLSPLTQLLLRKIDGRDLTSPPIFQYVMKEPRWNLHSYLGVEWTLGNEGDHCGQKWMEVDRISPLDAYLELCEQRLKEVCSPEVAAYKLSEMSHLLELEYYKEQFFGFERAWNVLETINLPSSEDLRQTVSAQFHSLCRCKSPKLTEAFSSRLIQFLSRPAPRFPLQALPVQLPLPQIPPPPIDPLLSMQAIQAFSNVHPIVDSPPVPSSPVQASDSPLRPSPPSPMQPPQPLHAPVIPVLTPGGIQLYHPDTNHCDLMQLPAFINADSSTAFVFTSDTVLFLCGGGSKYPLWNTAYQCLLHEGVRKVQSMAGRRHLHGVVAYQEEVFVFGGSDRRPLPICEKFTSTGWQPLPNMLTPRHSFNPVLSYPSIFLIGGEKCNAAEVFLIPENQFRPVPVSLPDVSQNCAFVDDEQIVVITKTKILRWRLGYVEGRPQVVAHIPLHPWSNTTPVHYQGRVFVVLLGCGPCIPGGALKAWDLSKAVCSSIAPT